MKVQQIGFSATTSGQTTITGRNLDDAAAIGIFMPSTLSTGITYAVTVSPSLNGTVFFPVLINPQSSAAQTSLQMSSASGVATAGPYYVIEPVTFQQIRITATANDTTFPSWILTKYLYPI